MTEAQKATILANKGLCLDQLGRAEDAVAVLEEALALKEDPGIAEVRDQIAVSILTDKVKGSLTSCNLLTTLSG